MLGIIPTYINKKYKAKIICFSLAFAAGVMFTISFISLIPEAVCLFNDTFYSIPAVLLTIIFIILGLFFSYFTDSFINKFINDNLYKLGIISVIVLMFHNIPEGIMTFISSSSNISLGISLSVAIALHNIPEGISIAIPIYYSKNSRKMAFFYTFIAGFSEFFGAILAYLFISKFVNSVVLAIILSITSGIMIYISLYELLPNSLKYKKNKTSLFGFILGIIIMIVCNLFI